MKISQRTGLSLLLLAIFISLIAQYPFFKVHAGNWDHYFILLSSDTISRMGYAPWIVNWSSYFGLHRISYPQGVPFLLSSFQQLSGDYFEDLVLVSSYAEGLMAVVFSFALGLTMRKRDYLFAFLTAFLFSTAPGYLYASEWTSSARGLFVTILPMVLVFNMMLLDAQKNRKTAILLNVFIIILMFSIHRMAFFLIATVIPALLLSSIAYKKRNYIVINKMFDMASYRKKYIIGIFLFILFATIIYSFYTQKVFSIRLEQTFTSSKIISGDSPLIKIINLTITFITSAGILVFFGLFSVIDIFRNKNIDIKTEYVLTILLFLLAIVFYPTYFRPYASIFLSILIAIYLIIFIYSDKNFYLGKIHISKKIIPFLLVLSIIFSLGMQMYWDSAAIDNSKQYMDYQQEEVVSAINMTHSEKTFMSDNHIKRFAAVYSGAFVMPPGGYSYDYYFYIFSNCPEFMNAKDVKMSFSPRIAWGGEFYIYDEHLEVNNSLYSLYNLSSYNAFEVDSKQSISRFSYKGVLNDSYEIYANENYGIYVVDSSNYNIQRTKLYFMRP